MLHFLYVKQLEVSFLKFYEKNKSIEHIMALLPLWVIFVLMTYFLPFEDFRVLKFLGALYVLLIVHFASQIGKLERVIVKDNHISTYRGFKAVQEVDLSEVAYILSRTAYLPVTSGKSAMLKRERVIDICTKGTGYVRLPVEKYDKDYIEEIVLMILRANRSTKIYVS